MARLLTLLLILVLGAGGVARAAAPAVPPPPAVKTAPAAPLPLTSPDRKIRARLKEIYAGMEGLEGVRAEVSGGVVTLRGKTLTLAQRNDAEAVAKRLDGVVAVENDLEAERRIGRRLEPLFNRLQGMLTSTIAFLPVLALAAAVFAAFWWFGRFLTHSTHIFRRIAPNAFIEALLEQIIGLGFILLGVVAAVSILGATALLGSVLGAAGLLGLAVGFAVRDTIENYIASVLLSVRQPFSPNDHVIIEGYEGKITVLNDRATVLTTFDGSEVRIPNATVYKANITNFSRTPERRFEFEIAVDPQNDLSCVLVWTLEALKAVPGVLENPAPAVLLDRIETFSATIKVYGWADQRTSDYGKVRSEALRQTKGALEKAGVTFPEPVQSIRQLPLPEPPSPAEPPRPSEEAMAELQDTAPDRTLDRKVHAIRAESDRDLLRHNGPKE